MARRRAGDELPQGHLAGEALRDVVRAQIRIRKPPETEQTYRRLRQDGHSDRDAVELIAAVLAAEIFNVLKHQTPHDPIRYATNLKRLPELPWGSDE